MPNITLSVADETKKKMDAHPEVRWSSAVRTLIERKLRDFEEAERIAAKSRLTNRDLAKLKAKVDRDFARHAEGLLNENNS